LQKNSSKPWHERLADFHLLLHLSRGSYFNMGTDMEVLVDAVVNKSPVPEGYTLIIDSLAGM
jgi:nuclear protein localization family protein 4